MFDGSSSLEYINSSAAKIKVIGAGGGGGNAIARMYESNLAGVEYIVANTDAQALQHSPAPYKLQLGSTVTQGLGAGANPEVGREAAMEDLDRIREALDGADMVFVTAGMGGGTGTGAAPVIAKAAREVGALTVGVVTRPFHFEGTRRMNRAEEGIRELQESVDTLIVIPNQRLLAACDEPMTLINAFKLADQVLHDAVQGISELITHPGHINVDFADVRTIMSNQGLALMGTGSANGPDRALEAVQKAISNPLLSSVSIRGATRILINFTGSSDLEIAELSEAVRVVQDEAHPNVDLIWGTAFEQSMGDEIKITVIATGFEESFDGENSAPEARPQRHVKPARPQSQGGRQREALSTLSPPNAPPVPNAPAPSQGDHLLPGFIKPSSPGFTSTPSGLPGQREHRPQSTPTPAAPVIGNPYIPNPPPPEAYPGGYAPQQPAPHPERIQPAADPRRATPTPSWMSGGAGAAVGNDGLSPGSWTSGGFKPISSGVPSGAFAPFNEPNSAGGQRGKRPADVLDESFWSSSDDEGEELAFIQPPSWKKK